ncbi:MAG TPA: Mut7-C RNAse domain-containing protein [Candidatus Deferrimicrobiaceae bacterium]|nr:Mut7-C RNAse domain-containing protein [Candidatus Deferrimicrobiaceae bacterium]
MRFFADAMLGKLAKWLRILGCDVAFDPAISDGEIAVRARREGRVILTRDTLLIRRKEVRDNCFFVRGDSYRDQLRQVVDHFRIHPSEGLFTRCVRCNELLADLPKPLVAGKVPPYVYRTQESFGCCARCGRIFWKATHWEEMEKHRKEMLRL